MKYLPVFPAVMLFPAWANAGGGTGAEGGFSFFSSFVQMCASLAVVIGLILVFHYFSKKWMKGGLPGSAGQKYIRVVETRFLAPKKALMLVEVAGEYMLVGSCGDNVTLIKEIDMIEEVEIVGELSPSNFRDTFQDKLKGFASRVPLGIGSLAATMKRDGART
jgi:flagellar protein FliO/FliZ